MDQDAQGRKDQTDHDEGTGEGVHRGEGIE